MKPAFYLNPRFQVISTWLWFFLFPLSLIGIFVGILQMDLSTMLDWWRSHQYYQAFFETITAGLLPVVYVWISKDSLSRFGLQQQGLLKSVLLSLGLAAVLFTRSYLTTGVWIDHSDISADLGGFATIGFIAWGLLANGPLEIFFYVFLLEKTDQILSGGIRLLSKGFWITTILHSLVHIVTTQDIENALNVFVIFFFLGLIYRYTRNAIGPMIGWTLINGMVWAFITIPIN